VIRKSFLFAALAATLVLPGAALAKDAAPAIVETASGLRYQVLAPGDGGAHPGDTDVTLVNYEGKLTDGSTFDKSSEPTPMPVDAVVPGFSEALRLMPKGAKYRVWLKPELAYGAEAQTGPDGKVVIPANATLVFDIELLDFITRAEFEQMIQQARSAQPAQQASPAGAPPTQP